MIDTVGSQANRLEPIFKSTGKNDNDEELNPLASLVPQIEIVLHKTSRHRRTQPLASCFARCNDKRRRTRERPCHTTLGVRRGPKLENVARRRTLVRELPIARLRWLNEHPPTGLVPKACGPVAAAARRRDPRGVPAPQR